MAKISMLDEYNQEHLAEEKDLVNRTSAYGILLKKGKVLLVRDSKSQTWEFPGGGLDKGETKEQGVIREFLEETGLQVDPDNIKFFKDIQDYFYSNTYEQAWNSLRYFYFVKVFEGAFLEGGNGDDTAAVGFFTQDQVKSLAIKPKIFQIVNEVFSGI